MSSQGAPLKEPFYFGGLAGCAAALVTHPLDLIKVRLQVIQDASKKPGFFSMGVNIVQKEGISGIYSGLSASLLRQATYTTTRFACYDVIKAAATDPAEKNMPLWKKIVVGCIAGGIGGFVGVPADMVNVRMQADGRLPPEQRRNYKHALDGLMRVAKQEGVLTMWQGTTPMITRGMLMTAGQLAFYDQFKEMLIASGYFGDTLTTHFTSSTMAGFVATALTMPFDVVKTRVMNSPKGHYSGPIDCLRKTVAQEGLMALYRGFVPAFVRLGPHTIVTFVALEQFKIVYRKVYA